MSVHAARCTALTTVAALTAAGLTVSLVSCGAEGTPGPPVPVATTTDTPVSLSLPDPGDPAVHALLRQTRDGLLEAPAPGSGRWIRTLAPGTAVTVDGVQCSLGPVFAAVAYTARHCTPPAGVGTPVDWTPRTGTDTYTSNGPLGTVSPDPRFDDVPHIFGDFADLAEITLDDATTVDPRIGGVYPVAPTPASPAEVTSATVLCLWGATSGESCGTAVAADTVRVFFGAHPRGGDSGGPVYFLDDRGVAHVVGIVTNALNILGGGIGIWLEPLLP